MTMNKVLSIAAAVLILFGVYVFYSWIKDERRESSYQATVIRFKQDLPPGIDRVQVVRYLDTHHLKYSEVVFGFDKSTSYEIQIDELPPSLVCGTWKVYVVWGLHVC